MHQHVALLYANTAFPERRQNASGFGACQLQTALLGKLSIAWHRLPASTHTGHNSSIAYALSTIKLCVFITTPAAHVPFQAGNHSETTAATPPASSHLGLGLHHP
jgi:hypothetical protein